MTSEIDDIDQAIARFEALDAQATPGPWIDDNLFILEPRYGMALGQIDEFADRALTVSLRNESLPLLRRLRDEVAAARRERDQAQYVTTMREHHIENLKVSVDLAQQDIAAALLLARAARPGVQNESDRDALTKSIDAMEIARERLI